MTGILPIDPCQNTRSFFLFLCALCFYIVPCYTTLYPAYFSVISIMISLLRLTNFVIRSALKLPWVRAAMS